MYRNGKFFYRRYRTRVSRLRRYDYFGNYGKFNLQRKRVTGRYIPQYMDEPPAVIARIKK